MSQARVMILFFPQYQAGQVPSNIPVGTPSLRALWKASPGFCEVPLQATNPDNPDIEGRIKFRKTIRQQLLDATELIKGRDPDIILSTGGDCGSSFSAISYMNEKYAGKIGVIWIDAHGDIHTPSTSPSQKYHGMVLRNLMGSQEFDLQPALALKPCQIAYLGLRDTEQAEDEFIQEHGIIRYGALDIASNDAPLDKVLEHFKKHGITHIHLHVDCDVMDKEIFPHVHVPEPDGLSVERLLQILRYLRQRMPMSGCCLTEYAPVTEGAGLDIIKRIYTEGFGFELACSGS